MATETIQSFCSCVWRQTMSSVRAVRHVRRRTSRRGRRGRSRRWCLTSQVRGPPFLPQVTVGVPSQKQAVQRMSAGEFYSHLSFRLPGEMYGRRGQVWGNTPPLWWIAAADSEQTGTKEQRCPELTNLCELTCWLEPVHLWPPAGKESTWPLDVPFTVNGLLEFWFGLLSSCSADICAAGHRHSGTFPRAEQGKLTLSLHFHNAYCSFFFGQWKEMDRHCASLRMLVPPFI